MILLPLVLAAAFFLGWYAFRWRVTGVAPMSPWVLAGGAAAVALFLLVWWWALLVVFALIMVVAWAVGDVAGRRSKRRGVVTQV